MNIITRFLYSYSHIKVPSVNLDRFLNGSKGWEEDCKEVADILHRFGLLYVKDTRVDPSEKDRFIDMME
jgi:hypothetical protein